MKFASSKIGLLLKKIIFICIALGLVFVVTNKFVKEKILKPKKTFSEEEAPTKISSIKINIPERDYDFLFSDMPLSNRVFQKGKAIADDQPEIYDIAIRLRGDHGWHWYKEKPSFRLKVSGVETIYSRKEIDFINPEDPSGFSNVISNIMATKAEIPHFLMTFGQVYMNNEYKGLYLISDTKNSYNLKNYDGVTGPVVTGNDWDCQIWNNEKLWEYEFVENGKYQPEMEDTMKKMLAIFKSPTKESIIELSKYLDFDKTAKWSAFISLIGSVHIDDFHNNYFVYDKTNKSFFPIITDPTGFGALTSFSNHKNATSSVEIPIYEYLTPIFAAYFRNSEFQYKRNQYLYKYANNLLSKDYLKRIVNNWRKIIEPLFDIEKNASALINIEKLVPIRIPVSASYRKKDIDMLIEYYNLRTDYILKELEDCKVGINPLKEENELGLRQYVVSVSGNSPIKWDFSNIKSKIYVDKDLNKTLTKEDLLKDNNSISLFYPALTKDYDFSNIRYSWLQLGRRTNKYVLKPDIQTYLIGIDEKKEAEFLDILINKGKNAVTDKPVKVTLNSNVTYSLEDLYKNTYSFHPWSKNEKN